MKKVLTITIKPILIIFYSLFSTQYVFCDENIDVDNKKVNKMLGWSLIITIIIIYYFSATGGGSEPLSTFLDITTNTRIPVIQSMIKEKNNECSYLEALKILTSFY